ncbi:acyl-CoA dehydrogenase family protein [Streptomyces achromogenes]|uniref:acyl-CoA dehydrogenase family protein n=1 Tax=Streptomyces achromogenes TaxID=67255 RepID=UPI0036F54DBA
MNDTHQPQLIDRGPVPEETREWLERVAAIAPVIKDFRAQGERDRRAPVEVFEALRDAGIHRMAVSKAFGGHQVDLRTAGAVIQELAVLDPSVAWQMGVQGAIGRFSDYLPERTAEKLFDGQSSLVIGSVNPTGRAERVPGGYRLEGTWSFASGAAHAEWFVAAAVVTERGSPRMSESGMPEMVMAFVPRSRVRLLDTWHSLGLRGTGSVHYEIDGVLVMDDHAVSQAAMSFPPAARPSRAYPISYYDFGLFGTASVCLGIARGALASFKELAGRKTPMGGLSTLASGHVVQDRLARAEILVRSSRLLLADAAWHAVEHGEDGGDSLSATLRLSAATIAENCAQAVDTVFTLAGSSSVYADSRLEAYFRDMHSAAKHITVSPTNIEMAGQYLLGGGLQLRR